MASVTTSICGIDVGSENCYVAVARQGGIEILLNEYSQRSTPSYIGFGGNQRELGVSAKQKQMMNLNNTCFAPSLIIGKKYEELDLSEIPYQIEKGNNGDFFVVVNHNGESVHLSPAQVLAMLFTKLRQISGNVVDCVINCPNYFTDTQKRALQNAAVIAGLNPLKIIPDMTAIALYYGFYRNSTSQDISIVAFVDCGYSSIQASVVLFNHKENSMRILEAGYEPNVGGKNLDEILAEHFIKEKKLNLSKRAHYRLIAECEKVKKQMSANSNELPINIECLQDDRDFSARIDRTKFEELAELLMMKINIMLAKTYQGAEAKYKKDFSEKFGNFKIDAVEIVGGTSRIPSIKRMVKDIFHVEPSTTLNADEAVARGCALQCAILSPTFKVARELEIIDSLAYQINFRYSIDNKANFKAVNALYPKGHQYPFTKQISLTCQSLPLTAAFDYVKGDGTVVQFAEYVISKPENEPLEWEPNSPIKLKVRVDASGVFFITSATVEKAQEVKNCEPMDQSPTENAGESMETDQATQNNQEPNSNESQETEKVEAKRKSKPKTTTIALKVTPIFIEGTDLEQQKNIEFEANLILADKNWKEKTDAKNALEEFIYEWRDRLESGSFDVFIKSNDKANFQQKLEENENWLYQQDEEEKMHSKSVYEERTNAMTTAFASKVLFLKKEFENRPRYLEQLGKRLQQAEKLAQPSTDPDEKEELDKFVKEMQEKSQWFDNAQGKLANAKTFDEPPVKCDEIQQHTTQVDQAITRLLNSRNRRAEQKRKAAETAAAEAKKQAEQRKKQAEAGDNEAAAATPVDNMEVDPNETQNEASS